MGSTHGEGLLFRNPLSGTRAFLSFRESKWLPFRGWLGALCIMRVVILGVGTGHGCPVGEGGAPVPGGLAWLSRPVCVSPLGVFHISFEVDNVSFIFGHLGEAHAHSCAFVGFGGEFLRRGPSH